MGFEETVEVISITTINDHFTKEALDNAFNKINQNSIIQGIEICWKRWNSNDRTCEMNVKPDFIRFKGESKVTIITIFKLYGIGKNVTDIDWIAEIPKEFEISNLSILK